MNDLSAHTPRTPGAGRAAPRSAAARTLRLDQALALLHQAGHAEPAGERGSVAYLQQLVDQLVALSSRDPLTGLANRRSLEMALTRELDRVARSGESALLLMVDIDHFKRINDQHGHDLGDQVIRGVGQALGASVRPMDMVARVGGEEFAILLPNCPAAFGPRVAERIRQMVAANRVPLGNDRSVAVTVSVGGAFAPQWVRSNPQVWLKRADVQLYKAKADGRDRVCFEPSVVSAVSADERELLMNQFKKQGDQ